MANQQYAAPSMEVVKFGHEDIVCVASGRHDGHGNKFPIIEEDPNNPKKDDEF